MIAPALLAGAVCLALAAIEAWRHPGEAYATVRLPVIGVWAATWLAYGLNMPAFPAPDGWTMAVLTAACVGSLLTLPRRSRVEDPADTVVPTLERALLVVSVLTIAWDLWHIAELVFSRGLTPGLVQYRVDRILKLGEFSVPGMEVLHAAITAAGALGFGQWIAKRRLPSAVLAGCGLAAALLSTGRWDMVAYVIWLLGIYSFSVTSVGVRRLASQVAIYLALGVYFVAHGQLMGKVDGATSLANASSNERAEIARADRPLVRSGRGRLGQIETRATPAEPIKSCPRWEGGGSRSNQAFRSMSSVQRVLVLYFAGPLATLDRALCEGLDAERVVLLYWPNKIARVVGLRPAEDLLAVDPFLDIGIPFNNYTVVYHFLSEVGPMSGLVAWVVFGAAVGAFSSALLRSYTVSGVVAGTAPVAMAIRTPWNNTFFDGTLLIWVAVALSPIAVAWIVRRASRQ